MNENIKLPEGWIEETQGNICKLGNGEKAQVVGFPYFDVKYLRGQKPKTLVNEGRFVLKGTKVIIVDGENSGEVFTIPEDGYMGSTCKTLEINPIINDKYLLYFIETKRQFYKKNKKGSATPHLDKHLFANTIIKFPKNLDEQQRIVSKIEELLTNLEESKIVIKKTNDEMLIYKQAILKNAFNKCKDKTLIENVCTHVTDGDHMPPPKSDNGIPFIMISNISNQKIDWSKTHYVKTDYFKNIDDKRKPKKGDVLYTVTGSYGIPVLIDYDKEFCFQRHIALLRPNKNIRQKFLYYALSSPQVYTQATQKATGTAQKTVGLGVLRKFEIPFTNNLYEQDLIINDIETQLSVCDEIQKTINNIIIQSEFMKQSILKKAFEGGYNG